MPLMEVQMADQKPIPMRYPLLESLLAQKNLALKGIYTNHDAAEIFDVKVRTIQDWVRNGDISARNLPGRARFLSEDLEGFLQNSERNPAAELEVENR